MLVPRPSPPQQRRKSQSSIFLPAFAKSRLRSHSSGQGKPWQPWQLPLSKFIAFHVKDCEGFGKFGRSGAPPARGRGTLIPQMSSLPATHSQLKGSLRRHISELGSSSRDREDPVVSLSRGWACRHQDGARYMAEHQYLLDVGSCREQPGRGEPRTARTSPWEDQLWSWEPSWLAPGEQRACEQKQDS